MRTLFLYSCDGGPNDGQQRETVVDHSADDDPRDPETLKEKFFPALDHPNGVGLFFIPLGSEADVSTPIIQAYGDDGERLESFYSDLR